MAIYDYKAKDLKGNTTTGAVEASSEMVAADLLKERDLIVLALSERKRKTLFQTSLGFLRRVPRKEIVVFARQTNIDKQEACRAIADRLAAQIAGMF